MSDKQDYHHGDLRNALIDSASLLLEQKGIDGLSLRDVAKQAGVSHAAPYRHFENKTELLAIMMQKGFVRLELAVNKATLKKGLSSTEKLIAAGVAYVQEAVRHPEIMRLMFSGHLDYAQCPPGLEASAEQAYRRLSNIIEAGIEDGSFRNQDSQILTMTAWSAMHGLAMLYLAGQFNCAVEDQQPLEQLAFQVATTVVHGINNSPVKGA
jgi:AcrR family transcriptional regulator